MKALLTMSRGYKAGAHEYLAEARGWADAFYARTGVPQAITYEELDRIERAIDEMPEPPGVAGGAHIACGRSRT